MTQHAAQVITQHAAQHQALLVLCGMLGDTLLCWSLLHQICQNRWQGSHNLS